MQTNTGRGDRPSVSYRPDEDKMFHIGQMKKKRGDRPSGEQFCQNLERFAGDEKAENSELRPGSDGHSGWM